MSLTCPISENEGGLSISSWCCCRQECARYLETMKSYETKSADAIQGRTEEDYLSRLNAAMTTVRGVNRTDVLTLGRAFGSVAGTMRVGSLATQDWLPLSNVRKG